MGFCFNITSHILLVFASKMQMEFPALVTNTEVFRYLLHLLLSRASQFDEGSIRSYLYGGDSGVSF